MYATNDLITGISKLTLLLFGVVYQPLITGYQEQQNLSGRRNLNDA